MYHQLKQFVNTFRELEQRPVVPDDEERRQRLREVLTVQLSTEQAAQPKLQRKTLAVASLYPRAGASFVTGNMAYYMANRGIHTTLCEIPGSSGYLCFALDSERRKKEAASGETLLLHNGSLKVQVALPVGQRTLAHHELSSWFMSVQRGADLLIVDLSSNWQGDWADLILEWVDEAWFVLDSDIPRIAAMCALPPPVSWQKHATKIRLIANRWNEVLAKSSVIKKLEGTLSLWQEEYTLKKIEAIIPSFDSEDVTRAHLAGKLLVEVNPDKAQTFSQLASLLYGYTIDR